MGVVRAIYRIGIFLAAVALILVVVSEVLYVDIGEPIEKAFVKVGWIDAPINERLEILKNTRIEIGGRSFIGADHRYSVFPILTRIPRQKIRMDVGSVDRRFPREGKHIGHEVSMPRRDLRTTNLVVWDAQERNRIVLFDKPTSAVQFLPIANGKSLGLLVSYRQEDTKRLSFIDVQARQNTVLLEGYRDLNFDPYVSGDTSAFFVLTRDVRTGGTDSEDGLQRKNTAYEFDLENRVLVAMIDDATEEVLYKHAKKRKCSTHIGPKTGFEIVLCEDGF